MGTLHGLLDRLHQWMFRRLHQWMFRRLLRGVPPLVSVNVKGGVSDSLPLFVCDASALSSGSGGHHCCPRLGLLVVLPGGVGVSHGSAGHAPTGTMVGVRCLSAAHFGGGTLPSPDTKQQHSGGSPSGSRTPVDRLGYSVGACALSAHPVGGLAPRVSAPCRCDDALRCGSRWQRVDQGAAVCEPGRTTGLCRSSCSASGSEL